MAATGDSTQASNLHMMIFCRRRLSLLLWRPHLCQAMSCQSFGRGHPLPSGLWCGLLVLLVLLPASFAQDDGKAQHVRDAELHQALSRADGLRNAVVVPASCMMQRIPGSRCELEIDTATLLRTCMHPHLVGWFKVLSTGHGEVPSVQIREDRAARFMRRDPAMKG